MGQIGFDNDKYLAMQSAHIRERISKFGGKLYLEFGGKLFDDFHASRVLPGFQPDSKIRMLQQLRDDAEIVIAVNANDIEKNKVRGDLGITYDDDCLRLIDAFRSLGLYVGGVCITQYAGQNAADAFIKRLNTLGVRNYRHYPIAGYPSDVAHIVSDRGLWPQRVYRDDAFAHRRHRAGPRQRQDGDVPLPALPRAQTRRERGLRQV